jgi:LmbE family N-acetylglucosaminyl deacetylase
VRLNLPTPASALAIAAHPDDAEFGAGGTLAKWAAAGCTIHHVVCTDGSKGSWDPDEDTVKLVATRQDEQRAASRALGGSDASRVVFLDNIDGELDSGLAQRREVARVIRELRPEVVLAHDPWRRYRLHPDHRHAGLLAVDGIVAARDPHFYADLGLEHWRPSTLLLFEADDVDHMEDVTATIDRKVAALWCHTSQLRSTMGVVIGSADEPQQRARFERHERDRSAVFGRQVGLAFAEGFKRIDEL